MRMKESSILNVLAALKTRLDENNQLDVHSTSGIYTKIGFNFNKPITIDKLEQVIAEKSKSVYRDGKHNGKDSSYLLGSHEDNVVVLQKKRENFM